MEELVGSKIGFWEVLEVKSRARYSNSRGNYVNDLGYMCKCKCGETRWVSKYNLVAGKSSGCAKCRSGKLSHGMSGTDIYHIWEAMKQRCYNSNHKQYDDYGGRGIVVCDSWKDSPEAFIAWAESNGYEKGLQIDREDNDKGYYPSNCRFVKAVYNLCNDRILRKSNTTGYRGVSKVREGVFLAIVGFKSKSYRLGRYPNPKTAAMARDLFCVKFGIPVTLNDQDLKRNSKFIEPTDEDIKYWRTLTKEDLEAI
jgi:hypothetical protein